MDMPNVLLVDDDEAFLEVLSRRLVLRGFNISKASNGEQALTSLSADVEIEVIVLDLKMPGRSGLETLVEIKKIRPLVEVVLLTGQGDVVSGVCSMKQGAFDFLQKPFDTDELSQIIIKAATRKREYEKEVLLVRSTPPMMRDSLLDKVSPAVRKIFRPDED